MAANCEVDSQGVNANLKHVCDLAEAASPDEGPFRVGGGDGAVASSAANANPLLNPAMLGGLMSTFMGGAGTGGGAKQAEMQNAISSIMGSVGDIITTLANDVSKGGPPPTTEDGAIDIGEIMYRIGGSMQREDILKKVSTASEKVSEITGNLNSDN